MSRIIKTKKILVAPKEIKRLQDTWGCSLPTIYNALCYRSMSRLATEIRNAALKSHGGIEKTIPVMID